MLFKLIFLLLSTLGCYDTSSAFHPTFNHLKSPPPPSLSASAFERQTSKHINNNKYASLSKMPTKTPPPTITTTTCHMELPITAIATGGAIISAASAFIYFSGSEDRQKKNQYAEWEEKDRLMREERTRLAYIEPREYWTEEELKPYDGTDEDGPILMGVNGEVYNVWKGRHFYGPGCEYSIFAGRDATRLLGKSKLEEETEEEKRQKLSIADRAALQGWIYTFKTKYEVVGKLKGFDPSTTTTRTT